MSRASPDHPPGFADAADLIFDSWVLASGPTEYIRDFDLLVAVPAAKPDGSGSYIEGEYRIRFTHCPTYRCETLLTPDTWRRSWSDAFTDFTAWERAGEPDGFIWAQGPSAYPGPSLVEGSPLAEEWSGRLGRDMHELKLETNAYTLWLVFHAVGVAKVSQGDPETGECTPI